MSKKAKIILSLYSGSRKPFSTDKELILRVHNGQSTDWITKTLEPIAGKTVTLIVDFFDNFADNYAVLISCTGFKDSGYFPIAVSTIKDAFLNLMVVSSEPEFHFLKWEDIRANHPVIAKFLSLGMPQGQEAQFYSDLFQNKSKQTACLLNLATAMSQIQLADGTPLDYFRAIDWDSLAQDRLFGYVNPALVDQVKRGAQAGTFTPEIDPSLFHGDATCSYKEVRLGEANVQLTFHENDRQVIDGETCVRLEPDIDYYKDPAAHALLEVVHNLVTHSLTEPAEVYTLRWIAGKQHGLPEFNPPYWLE